jgi:hypothetical protein
MDTVAMERRIGVISGAELCDGAQLVGGGGAEAEEREAGRDHLEQHLASARRRQARRDSAVEMVVRYLRK